MRVSIVNPRKTKKTRKNPKPRKSAKKASGKRRVSAKQRAAARRNIKKAQAALRMKKSGRKAGKKRKAHRSKPRKSRKGRSKKAVRSNPKRRRKSRKARKNPSGKLHSRAGKTVRPRMKIRYKNGRKSLVHAKKSRYARKGYRFNPGFKGVVSMKGGKLDVPHIAGGVVGFMASGYVGGLFVQAAQKAGAKDIVPQVVGIAGNVVGTEASAYVVHYAVGKLFKKPALATPVARGVRIGGYVATALNAVSIGLKVLKIPVPFRALGDGSQFSDLVLSGIGDMDLALGGLGGTEFSAEADYAALDAESDVLNGEIEALSSYLDGAPGEYAGLSGDSEL